MNYENWKGWGVERFGSTSRDEAAYFEAEVFDGLALPAKARLLEIGFGNGNFMGHARRLGHHITGIETNPELQDRASANGFTVCALPSDLVAGEFDAAVAFDVIEHISAEDTVVFLQSIARSVKPGGAILLRFPNGDSPFGRIYQYGDVTHLSVVGGLKLRYFAAAAGLQVVRVKNPERPLGHLSMKQRAAEAARSVARASIERLLGWVYFGSRLPLAPNMVAVLKTP